MPYYLGLLTENGREVVGEGYERSLLQDFNFERYQNLQVPLNNSAVRVDDGVVVQVRPYQMTVRNVEGIQEDPEPLPPPPPPPKSWQERLDEDLF